MTRSAFLSPCLNNFLGELAGYRVAVSWQWREPGWYMGEYWCADGDLWVCAWTGEWENDGWH
jgi:hypothetical protein